MKYFLLTSIFVVFGLIQLSSTHRAFSCESARAQSYIFANDPAACDTYSYCAFFSNGTVRRVFQQRCPTGYEFFEDNCWPLGTFCNENLICPKLGLGTLYATSDDCESYALCIGTGVGASKCADGKKFCRGRAACVDAATVDCIEPAPVFPDCSTAGDGYHPVPGDCSIYVFCYDGNTYQFECEAGLYFDPSVNTCVAGPSDICETTSGDTTTTATTTTAAGGEDTTTVIDDTTTYPETEEQTTEEITTLGAFFIDNIDELNENAIRVPRAKIMRLAADSPY